MEAQQTCGGSDSKVWGNTHHMIFSKLFIEQTSNCNYNKNIYSSKIILEGCLLHVL